MQNEGCIVWKGYVNRVFYGEMESETMTQLEALKVAYDELSNMMPYGDENSEIFEAAEVIQKMIHTKERQLYKKQMKNEPRSSTDRKYTKEINSIFDDLLSDL